MKLRKIMLPFVVSLLSLSACSLNTSEDKGVEMGIKHLYEGIRSYNFTAKDNELTQSFYSKDAVLIDIVDQVQTGIVNKGEQGIFEIHTLKDGTFESHGMLSPNGDLDITNFFSNMYALTSLSESSWRLSDNSYFLFPNEKQYDILVGTGFFYYDELDDIKEIDITMNKEEISYSMNVIYKPIAKKENYSIKIYNFGKNKNSKLDNFVKNVEIKAQTEWNEYQLSAIKQFGFWDVPFLKSFTIGLKLYFQKYAVYGGGGYIFIAFDYMSSKEKEDDIAAELIELNYKEDPFLEGDGVKVFTQEEKPGYNRVISFKYIPVEEIEENQRIAFPNGHMQISFNYALSEKESTPEEVNSILSNADFPLVNIDSSVVSKVSLVDYTDMMNESALDEDGLKLFEEAGIEPGNVFNKYCSIYFAISDYTKAKKFVEDYRKLLHNQTYIPSYYTDPDVAIDKHSGSSVSYYYYLPSDSLFPESTIDIYLLDSTYITWTGVVEFLVTSYTETGRKLFSYAG